MTDEQKNCTETFDRQVERHEANLKRKKGLLLEWFYGIYEFFFGTGRFLESNDDWLELQRLVDYTIKESNVRQGKIDLDKVALAKALLNLSVKETNMVFAWSYVNRANIVLMHSTDEPDLCDQYVMRFSNLSPILIGYLTQSYPNEIENLTKAYKDKKTTQLEIAVKSAQLWNLVNQTLHLSRKLWTQIFIFLFLFLFSAVSITEIAFHSGTDFTGLASEELSAAFHFPFFTAVSLGFFGAALSLMLMTRNNRYNAINYLQSRALSSIRILLGGTGAYIFTLMLQLDLGVLGEKAIQLATSVPGFMLLCVVSGFSERIFVDGLESIVGKYIEVKPQQPQS